MTADGFELEPGSGATEEEMTELRRAELAVAEKTALIDAVREAKTWRPRFEIAEGARVRAERSAEASKSIASDWRESWEAMRALTDFLQAELWEHDERNRRARLLVEEIRGQILRGC